MTSKDLTHSLQLRLYIRLTALTSEELNSFPTVAIVHKVDGFDVREGQPLVSNLANEVLLTLVQREDRLCSAVEGQRLSADKT